MPKIFKNRFLHFLIMGTSLMALALPETGCDQVRVRSKITGASNDDNQNKTETTDLVFRKDAPGGLFKSLKWYQYDMLTHIIWPFHDIYALKTGSGVYLLQVQNYYADQALTAGMFKVSYRKAGEASRSVVVDGRGCGNPYTNPNFESCSRNIEENLFGVLDLESGVTKTMTETEIKEDADWDIAFRGTDIHVNAGSVGPGKVQAALAERFAFYFDESGAPDVSRLRRPDLKDKALVGFEDAKVAPTYNYSLPEGIDRVLHESYWMAESADGLRTATGTNTWIFKNAEDSKYAKLRIPKIDDNKQAENEYLSTVTIAYQIKNKSDKNFPAQSHELQLNLSTAERLKTLCLRLFTDEVLECKSAGTNWDLKFTAIHRQKDGKLQRDWLIFTNLGAIGPLNQEEAETSFP